MALICRLDTEPPGGKPSQATSSSQKSFLFSSLKWNPASLIGGTTDAASKSHAALEVDNYFSDVIPEDDEINPLKYWRINSARFPLLSKFAVEIYSCPATTAGIERVFSIAGHLIGTRATTMKDENFEKKLFCNANRETMLSGRKRKSMDV